MNDAWLKADLETAQMVLSRLEHEDIPKLKRLLERIATIRGVALPTPRWPSTAPTQEMIDDGRPMLDYMRDKFALSSCTAHDFAVRYEANSSESLGGYFRIARCQSCGYEEGGWVKSVHPGESVQTWHEDKGPEWPEEEE